MLPITQGIKTSEFWLTALAIAVATAAPMLHPGSVASQIVTGVGVVLAALGYTAHRCIVKTAALNSPFGTEAEK